MTRRAVACAGLVGVAGLASAGAVALGQPIDPARPSTLVIGVPAGARAERVDSARTGLSRSPLPSSRLRVEWRASTSVALDHAPLVDARGAVYVVSARGEAIATARDGTERWRVPTGAVDPGPPALLSDDTLVVLDGSGDAVGVRDGIVRWRTHVGAADPADTGPLPLDDGGVVVPAGRDLAVLDAEGHERARIVLPEPAAAPLLWTLGRIVIVGVSGTVWTWAPGSAEPARAATFGSRTEGPVALAGDRTLLAIVAGHTSVAAVDILRGRPAVTRAVAPGGLWLGPLRFAATRRPSRSWSRPGSWSSRWTPPAGCSDVPFWPGIPRRPGATPALPSQAESPLRCSSIRPEPSSSRRSTARRASPRSGRAGAPQTRQTRRPSPLGVREGGRPKQPSSSSGTSVPAPAAWPASSPVRRRPSPVSRPRAGFVRRRLPLRDAGCHRSRGRARPLVARCELRPYSVTEMIKITEKAALKVKEIAEAEALLGQGLRLRVVGGGCAGFTYDLYFEDKVGAMDEQFECNGVKLYVDPMSFQYLENTEIDYVEGLHGAGFKFNNPNSKGSCGCGSSFSA